MFKCSECNKEYKIKPEYCDDCGNDEFIEIAENITTNEETSKNTSVEENKVIFKEELHSIHQEKKPYANETNFKTEKKEIKPEEIMSYIIFFSCIILSLIIIFFVNPEVKEKEEVVKEDTKPVAEIPAIDTFWNSEPPKNIQISKKVEPQPEIRKTETIQTAQNQPQQVQNKNVKIELKAPIKNDRPKNVIQANSTNKNSKVQEPKKQSNIQNKPQTKPSQAPVSKTNTQQTIKNTNSKTTSNTQPVWNYNQVQPQTQQQSKSQNQTQNQQTQTAQSPDKIIASKKELTNYKANLRNTIGRKIDFADVIGDGSCTISFKIDSSGKLINRKFAKQSTNTTLNDAVYKAVMATPSYNPPPSAYSGETLSLKITFYNGNFEINLN